MRLAVRCLRRGGVIAYPTEAVYGLGCDPWNAEAVAHLLAIKRRSVGKGLILIASDPDQLWSFVEPPAPDRLSDILATWPGPNTWLLPAHPATPAWLTGRFDTLAVRVSAHPLVAALCRAYGGAIVSTSANQAARPPARTSLDVRLALDELPDYILTGYCAGSDRPSVIRDGRTGRIIRA
ncbi:MAG: Sua5/YciO/YrdC/YwlC family protein [Chromatiales bacterium]|nr:Sua5/YciO/YrdC/YwlC family protein [Chromatiales bacterium]